MGFKLAGVMLILMLAMGGIVYWYYNDTQEKLAILHENNAKLETATKVQKQAIEDMEHQVELVSKIAKETSDQLARSRKKIEEVSRYQHFVHKSFLKLTSLAYKLQGSKRYIIRIISILIGIFTKEARSEIFRDLMYYQVLKKK